MSETNVVPITHEQLIIEGFPIDRRNTRFSLSNDKRLATDKLLSYDQHVTGTFSARVKGLHYVESGGDLVGVFIIEVLEAELD